MPPACRLAATLPSAMRLSSASWATSSAGPSSQVSFASLWGLRASSTPRHLRGWGRVGGARG
jgi:hypothetical protein